MNNTLHHRLSNNSATSGFVWEKFDFNMCEGMKKGNYIWASFTLLSVVLGLPASIAILWEMFKTHRRGSPLTPNDFFILNLTVMDIIFLVYSPIGIFNQYFLMNWETEAFWNLTFAMNTCGRPLLMACVCLDSYLAVVHPVIYHKRKSLTPRGVMAGIIWFVTLVVGIVYFLFYRVYFSMFTALPYSIAIIIIGVCDYFILHTLIKSNSGRKTIHPQKRRAIQTLINSLVMTVFSYLPQVFMFTVAYRLIENFTVFVCVVAIPINITSTLGSVIMPLLHLKSQGKLDRFRLRCCRKS